MGLTWMRDRAGGRGRVGGASRGGAGSHGAGPHRGRGLKQWRRPTRPHYGSQGCGRGQGWGSPHPSLAPPGLTGALAACPARWKVHSTCACSERGSHSRKALPPSTPSTFCSCSAGRAESAEGRPGSGVQARQGGGGRGQPRGRGGQLGAHPRSTASWGRRSLRLAAGSAWRGGRMGALSPLCTGPPSRRPPAALPTSWRWAGSACTPPRPRRSGGPAPGSTRHRRGRGQRSGTAGSGPRRSGRPRTAGAGGTGLRADPAPVPTPPGPGLSPTGR